MPITRAFGIAMNESRCLCHQMKRGVTAMERSVRRRDSLDWDKLRIFREVAHLGSMSSAASRLGGSLPTVSRRITELERELRAELFRRSTRGVILTDAGTALLYHADLIARVVEAMQEDVMDRALPDSGPVHITCCDMLGAYWVAARLNEFVRSNPAIEPRMTICSNDGDFADQDADVSIQFQRPHRPELVASRLGRLQFAFFCARHHCTDTRPQTLRDLRNSNCLVPEEYVRHLEAQPPPSKDLKRLIEDATQSNSMAALVNIARTGGGIVLLPAYMAEFVPELFPLPNIKIEPLEFWLVYAERLRRFQKGQALLEWARSLFRADQKPWFQESTYSFSEDPAKGAPPPSR